MLKLLMKGITGKGEMSEEDITYDKMGMGMGTQSKLTSHHEVNESNAGAWYRQHRDHAEKNGYHVREMYEPDKRHFAKFGYETQKERYT